ncbi:MAG: DoxX family protein [Verrucomicrobiota bacterium]
MNNLVEVAQGISAAGFLGYGICCFTTQRMRVEFTRYGLPRLRQLTGALQIAAGCGLLLGYAYPWCALAASLGLSLMMLVALGVRLRIRDPFVGFLQAFVCFLLNLFVFQGYLTQFLGKG